MTLLPNVPEALRPLLPELAGSLGDRLRQTREALGRGDATAAAAAAHAARGAAMYYRLPAMAHAAGELEESCRALPKTALKPKTSKKALAALKHAEGELAALRAALDAVEKTRKAEA